MKKLAIIGASELQNPLIVRAKEMGCETHVFAWAAGDIGEKTADYFYPISIVEREAILEKCREIGIDGICTIASDLANVCVGYVSHALGLPSNAPECVKRSTDKQAMRACFEQHACPSPASRPVEKSQVEALWQEGQGDDGAIRDAQLYLERALDGLRFPVIVKPIDRSGSRGVRKVVSPQDVPSALKAAFEVSFGDIALIEEFAEGREFSVEGCSWQGKHTILQITEKFTTGAPSFIEIGHLEPARITDGEAKRIRAVTIEALDALDVSIGASHTELKMDSDGTIRLIEVGSRMGGDCIGSDLVRLSTGVDFLGAVIDCALGNAPHLEPVQDQNIFRHVVAKYVLTPKDASVLDCVEKEHPDWIYRQTDRAPFDHVVSDSSTRMGFAILAFNDDLDIDYLGF